MSVCLVCVSCARISSLPFVWVVGVGAWVFFSGKQGCKLRGSKHAVGFTFNTVERLARMLLAFGWHSSCFVGCWGLVVCVVGCL